MIGLTALVIFLISLTGIGVIVIRKIPILAELPLEKIEKNGTLGKIKEKIKGNEVFSVEIILQEVLSRIRILTLRTENKTAIWLAKLRQKSVNRKKNKFSDDYWRKIKRGD